MESQKLNKKKPIAVGTSVVEVVPQKLRKIKPCRIAVLSLPANLSNNTRTIMASLFGIFEDKKSVEEGLVGDMIWGFKQGGIPPEATYTALGEMEKFGYVKFQAPDNTFVTLNSDRIGSAWIKYQPKLLDMIYYKGGKSGRNSEKST